MNKHYAYKFYRLQTSSNSSGWICFVNENDILMQPARTEEEALAQAKQYVDECYAERHSKN